MFMEFKCIAVTIAANYMYSYCTVLFVGACFQHCLLLAFIAFIVLMNS